MIRMHLTNFIYLGSLLLFGLTTAGESKKVVKIVVPKKVKYVHHTHVVLLRDKVKKPPRIQRYRDDHLHHYHHHLEGLKHHQHKKYPHHHHYYEHEQDTEDYAETTHGFPVYEHPLQSETRKRNKLIRNNSSKQKVYSNYDQSYYPTSTQYSDASYAPTKSQTFDYFDKFKPFTYPREDDDFKIVDVKKLEPNEYEGYESDFKPYDENRGYPKRKYRIKTSYDNKSQNGQTTKYTPVYKDYGPPRYPNIMQKPYNDEEAYDTDKGYSPTRYSSSMQKPYGNDQSYQTDKDTFFDDYFGKDDWYGGSTSNGFTAMTNPTPSIGNSESSSMIYSNHNEYPEMEPNYDTFSYQNYNIPKKDYKKYGQKINPDEVSVIRTLE